MHNAWAAFFHTLIAICKSFLYVEPRPAVPHHYVQRQFLPLTRPQTPQEKPLLLRSVETKPRELPNQSCEQITLSERDGEAMK